MPSKRTIPRTCRQCGHEFLANVSEVNRGAALFCSDLCYRASTGTTDERFWSKVDRTATCWTWQAGQFESGYGLFRVGDLLLKAHRWAYEQASGAPIPDGMLACHNCPDGDDPLCVRNDEAGIYIIRGIARPRFGHLWLGTPADNNADRSEKGRSARGEATSLARLTWAIAADIRAEYVPKSSDHGITALARKHGVGTSTIYRVLKDETWRAQP